MRMKADRFFFYSLTMRINIGIQMIAPKRKRIEKHWPQDVLLFIRINRAGFVFVENVPFSIYLFIKKKGKC